MPSQIRNTSRDPSGQFISVVAINVVKVVLKINCGNYVCGRLESSGEYRRLISENVDGNPEDRSQYKDKIGRNY